MHAKIVVIYIMVSLLWNAFIGLQYFAEVLRILVLKS